MILIYYVFIFLMNWHQHKVKAFGHQSKVSVSLTWPSTILIELFNHLEEVTLIKRTTEPVIAKMSTGKLQVTALPGD